MINNLVSDLLQRSPSKNEVQTLNHNVYQKPKASEGLVLQVSALQIYIKRLYKK